jgi:superfamily II DNA or RNA helicase
MSLEFRNYQKEADDACYDELAVRGKNRALIKMFCGTGKSKLMRQSKLNKGKKRVVYVFPSLSLIEQFHQDYLYDAGTVLQISSESEATTDPVRIQQFLSNPEPLILCVTYQSFNTLLDNLGETKIDVCHYDEAHHAVGETYQKLIFENTVCEKQIFYTATPKNANGVVMYDRDNVDAGMCGKLVYDYSYLKGVREGYLNPIEIRVDMFMENTNKSLYETMARAILASGNGRVLTFHADVNTDRPTSVLNFVNETDFIQVFKEVQAREFPKSKIQKIRMIGMTAAMKGPERRRILDTFDATLNDEVIIISSCETIGEGIDTKNANMCVFVDPKSSYVKIIQNIGRIIRKIFGEYKPNSTVLIPCWVDKTKYMDCDGDKEKCDEVIRQDMAEGGNFNGILNVLSALKQEDEDIYDICLNYPQAYSPSEIVNHLESQGYTIGEPGDLNETMEYLLGEVDGEDLEDIAQEHDVCIEVVNPSLDTPVERYNEGCEDIVRLYETDEGYCPLLKEESKRHREPMSEPNRANRVHFKVHTHPDVQVLWKITGDMSADICSCVLDCEVVVCDPMESVMGIVERANERFTKGGKLLPRRFKKITPELEQEARDATKIGHLKSNLKGKGGCRCSDEVREYLDEHLSGWRNEFYKEPMKIAKAIVERAKERQLKGFKLLPRMVKSLNPELEQEQRDASKLHCWKKGYHKCSDEVRDYLHEHLPGWNSELDLNEKSMKFALAIVERAKERELKGGTRLPREMKKNYKKTPELEQEARDASKLAHFKKALNGKGDSRCSDEVREYLDDHLSGWRNDLNEESMKFALAIVERAKERMVKGEHLLPRQRSKITPELEQEHSDASKLHCWKKGYHKCSDEVRDYLHEHLPGWNSELDLNEKSMKFALAIVERAKERVIKGGNLLPRQMSKKNRTSEDLEQEQRDSSKLNNLKYALIGITHARCSDEVRDYLDEHLPGWRTEDTEKPKKSTKSMKLKEPCVPKESPEQKRLRVHSEISELHQKYKTLTSVNLHYRFDQDPTLWHKYHALAEANEASFPTEQIPRNRIIQLLDKLKTKTKQVVDMGCGKAQIAEHFRGDKRFEFTNFDHVSSCDSVLARDISNTELEEDSVDICILSLAMWGANCKAYIQEAYRILESGGKLYIIEPTKRWTDKDEHGNILEKKGQKLKTLLEANGFKIVQEDIEKFCLLTCFKL